jgi:hypothetical protein
MDAASTDRLHSGQRFAFGRTVLTSSRSMAPPGQPVTVKSVQHVMARTLGFLARPWSNRSCRRRDEARRRNDGLFRLLGFLLFTIASLFAFGHRVLLI